MKIETQAQILTVYVGENDRWRSGLLYPAIIERLQEIGIAGVTVFHGTEGYGSHHKLHTVRFENLFGSLPVVIQAVDIQERIALALSALDEMVAEGLATVQDVHAIHYSPDPKR